MINEDLKECYDNGFRNGFACAVALLLAFALGILLFL